MGPEASTGGTGGRPFPPKAKLKFIELMTNENWQAVADLCEVPVADRARFAKPDEARFLWEWLDSRDRLHTLPDHLDYLELGHISVMLRQWNTGAGQPPLGAPPARQRDLNTLFFDLEDIRRRLVRAAAGPLAQVTPFVLPHVSATVAAKICEWLPYCFNKVVCKPRLTLGPLIGSVDGQVAQMTRLRAELRDSKLACHVDGVRAPEQTIVAFFERLTVALADAGHPLLVILTTAPDIHLPDPFTYLPSPVFLQEDVTMWAQRIVAEREWQPELAPAWGELVNAYALDEDDVLDPDRTYEVIELHLTELLSDAEGFRHLLEERTGHG